LITTGVVPDTPVDVVTLTVTVFGAAFLGYWVRRTSVACPLLSVKTGLPALSIRSVTAGGTPDGEGDGVGDGEGEGEGDGDGDGEGEGEGEGEGDGEGPTDPMSTKKKTATFGTGFPRSSNTYAKI